MKIYLIWDDYNDHYIGECKPYKNPHWYPHCFASRENAERYLIKDMIKKGYNLDNKEEKKTKGTYEFSYRGNGPYMGSSCKYIIIERTMK